MSTVFNQKSHKTLYMMNIMMKLLVNNCPKSAMVLDLVQNKRKQWTKKGHVSAKNFLKKEEENNGMSE